MPKNSPRFRKTHDFSHLLNPKNPVYAACILRHTSEALAEDLGSGDITTKILFLHKKIARAFIVSREAGIVAGLQEIKYFLSRRQLRLNCFVKDGGKIRAGQKLCELRGDAREILKVERTILNVIGRMSGVATFTNKIVARAKKLNPHILVCPTRKTLWGLLDKRACALGGGGTHRLGLSDAVLIKDNHLELMGRHIPQALKPFFNAKNRAHFIEIEVENYRDAISAAAALGYKNGIPCFIMLDNMPPKKAKQTISKLRKRGLLKHIGIEVSGGIREKNVAAYAATGADIISLGSLTGSAPMLDVSLEVEK